MRHRPLFLLVLAISLLLVACSNTPTTSPSEQHLADARNNFKSSDFSAALRNLDAAIKTANDPQTLEQASILRVALLTAMADADWQLAEAYHQGGRQPAAQSNIASFSKQRSDYNNTARNRLMDAMQALMDQRGKLNNDPVVILVIFPGFTGGTDPTIAKIKNGVWVGDSERLTAEIQAERNALGRVLSAIAGAGDDSSKGQQIYVSGKAEIDPRVYLVAVSGRFLDIGGMFEPRALNEPDHLRTVNTVVKGDLDVAEKLLASKPDKDLEARAKKMETDCDKTLKKLGT